MYFPSLMNPYRPRDAYSLTRVADLLAPLAGPSGKPFFTPRESRGEVANRLWTRVTSNPDHLRISFSDPVELPQDNQPLTRKVKETVHQANAQMDAKALCHQFRCQKTSSTPSWIKRGPISIKDFPVLDSEAIRQIEENKNCLTEVNAYAAIAAEVLDDIAYLDELDRLINQEFARSERSGNLNITFIETYSRAYVERASSLGDNLRRLRETPKLGEQINLKEMGLDSLTEIIANAQLNDLDGIERKIGSMHRRYSTIVQGIQALKSFNEEVLRFQRDPDFTCLRSALDAFANLKGSPALGEPWLQRCINSCLVDVLSDVQSACDDLKESVLDSRNLFHETEEAKANVRVVKEELARLLDMDFQLDTIKKDIETLNVSVIALEQAILAKEAFEPAKKAIRTSALSDVQGVCESLTQQVRSWGYFFEGTEDVKRQIQHIKVVKDRMKETRVLTDISVVEGPLTELELAVANKDAAESTKKNYMNIGFYTIAATAGIVVGRLAISSFSRYFQK